MSGKLSSDMLENGGNSEPYLGKYFPNMGQGRFRRQFAFGSQSTQGLYQHMVFGFQFLDAMSKIDKIPGGYSALLCSV